MPSVPKNTKITFLCQDCGQSFAKWNGRCPSCGAWGTIGEFAEARRSINKAVPRARLTTPIGNHPKPLSEQPSSDRVRVSTGLTELDRLLGGGLVSGSVLLLAGDPGVGKSTLLLQVAGLIAESGHRVLYVSGEESGAQVRLRGTRLSVTHPEVLFAAETDTEAIGSLVQETQPSLLILDSIQTLTSPDVPSTAGSVSQVRECAQLVLSWSKTSGIPAFMTGHVTKDGNIAGPRILEHMVDVVLGMEGESISNLRLLRCAKNRFGSTNDVALFEMRNDGLAQVEDPSSILVGERDLSAPGSAIAVTMEGSRPLLCEVQALTNTSAFAPPRRSATGVDFNRMAMLAAVLARRAHLSLGNQDVMVNIPGGLALSEPALDLAVAAAIASSYLDAPINPSTVLIGEVGLNGELRSVSHLERRLNEATRHGFTQAIVPQASLGKVQASSIKLLGVHGVREAIAQATAIEPVHR